MTIIPANVEWVNTNISVQQGQGLAITASGYVRPWNTWPLPGITPDGDPNWPTSGGPPFVLIPGAPFCMLVGRIGLNGLRFRVGSNFNGAANETGVLYLAINDVEGSFGDNLGQFDANISTSLNHSGLVGCPANYASIGADATSHSVSLRTGEKYEEITDLSLNTPAASLAFTRAYRQGRLLDNQYQFMGLGWKHNHQITLTEDTVSSPNTIIIGFISGAEIHFTKTASNHYDGDLGSVSNIDVDPTSDYDPVNNKARYILTTADQSTYLFDSSKQLRRRRWPNGEYWEYLYTAGKLSAVVDDGYDLGAGSKRQLQFTYISNPGQFNDGQLWRVGDQTASGLNGSSPSGRYIELSYIVEKLNGTTTGTPNPLLATVRDVRGNVWTYDWYGQHNSESDTNQKNFLTSYISPLVDTNGDNTVDTPTTLKTLTYAMSGAVINGINQKRGIRGTSPALVEETLAFQPNGQNITTQTVAGKTTIHRFIGGLYRGSELPGNNGKYTVQDLDNTFRPAQQTDANGNPTQLAWSDDGKRLNQVTDALNNTTGFTYNSNDTLQSSVDAQGRTTVYTYGNIVYPRQPTRIQIYDADGHTLLGWQEFTYDPKGRTLTEQVLDPKNPSAILQQIKREYYSSGNGNGLVYRTTQKDITGSNDVITTYSYDSAGRVTKTQQSSNFGSCAISFTVFNAAGNVVATLCNYDPGSNTDPTTVAQALALYNPRDPNKNRVTTYEYDALGRRIKTTVDAVASFAMINLTVYDALDRVVRTISNYVASPVVPQPFIASRTAFQHGSNNDQNLVTDTIYNSRGMVKRQTDVLGNVTLYGYDDTGRLVKTVQNASQDSYNNDYTDAASDPALARYIPNSRADQDIITTQAYDANGNLVKSTDVLRNVALTGYDALNRPVKTVRSASQPKYNLTTDPSLSQYIASSAPDQDLIDTTEYDALSRVIRTRRLLDNRPTEQWETTLYGYDGLGRQVRVIRSASQPDYNVTNDPSLSRYPVSDNTDQDIVSQTAYDASGRVQYTEDALGNRTWIAYDGLGRQVKTIVNPIGAATDNGVHDPRSPFYNLVLNVPDRDLISTTTYDSDGRVQYTQDVLGRRNWPVYDSLGRVVKSVTNASGNATDGRVHDPRSPLYARSTNTDQDIISQTIYDTQGRVSATLDTRGNQTRYESDRLGRRLRTITNYVDGISNSSIPDEDRVVTTTYDLAGRVISSRDAAGIETRYVYDALGRRTKTISNYVDCKFNSNIPDEDVISTTTYNRAGQVVTTTDVRGTQSTFTYDRVGRRLTVTQANGTPLATVSYTCYDKAGRVVRTIQNYAPQYNNIGQLISPDAQDMRGNWYFAPTANGVNNDTNLITRLAYDRSSRQIIVTDPLGNATLTTYFKDGQVNTLTDPEGMVTAYRYDGLRRRTRVVQSYIANGDDPARWYWNAGWKRNDGTAIVHGSNNDQNIIVDVAYDQGGRVVSMRDPMGSLTTYTYDLLDRRTSLVNPVNQRWLTTYFNVDNKTRTVMTYPGINGGGSYAVQRDFDRLGRLATLSYGAPSTTPDIKMTYNTAGDRIKMTEYSGAGFTTPVRDTQYSYDRVHRLTQAAFDTDGSGSIDESVSYAYDAGGLRTQMTLPGSLNLSYAYNAKGQLVGMTDWDGQYTQFLYDAMGRHVVTQRANGLYSRYSYDAGGRLRELRHHDRNKTLAHFLYQVDHRGNRTQAFEELARPSSIVQTIGIADGAVSYYKGTWTTNGSYKQTTQFSSAMTISFTGNEAVLSMGTGTDHGIYDVYIDGSLWESFDGYSTAGADRLINIYLDKRLNQTDVHVIDIRCRAEKNKNSSGYTLRFKQLVILNTVYDRQTINYGYDALTRLLTASYAGVSPTRTYQYAFDRAGNRTQQVVTIGGTPTTTDYEYATANQILRSRVNAGAWTNFTYDNNGNLRNDGVNSYTWDRANRLLSMGGVDYQYDGEGRRVQQTVSSTVTKYLLDIQPGLAVVLSETTGANTMRYVHSPRGIHAHKDTGGNWEWMVQDGLGSVREVVDNSVGVLESRNYDPYGNPFGATGTSQTGYGFTGELVDGSGLLDLRARRYNAGLGTFASLDPFEGMRDRAMSLNGYSWVEGNVPNMVDPSGMSSCDAIPVPNIANSYEVCKAKCKNSQIFSFPFGSMNDYLSCISKCEPLKHRDVAKNATVMIALTGDASAAGEKPCTRLGLPPAETSLGALSTEGAWTHDHNSGPDPYYGQDPSNQSEAKRWLKLYPCITFTGVAGKVTIVGSDLAIGNSVAGTILIEDAQIASDGRHINLSQLGIAVAADKSWTPGTQASVFVAHVLGSHDDNNKWLDHNYAGVLQFDVNTTKPLAHDGQGRPFYETNLRRVIETWGEYIWRGDSGGGVFFNDRLIGVNFQDQFDANPPTLTGLYFVPIS